MKIGSVVMSRIVKDEIFGQILVAGRAFGIGSVSWGSPSTRGIIITTPTTVKTSASIILTSIPLIPEFFGVGLGGSIEKLHWLPEPHTDFMFAVIGEEFGLIGVIIVISLFFWLTRRIMKIGRQAIALERIFSGFVAQGIAIWIGFQSFINIGVNLGALPTKGLTLPLMSYGGSAVIMNVIAMTIVARIDYENRLLMRGKTPWVLIA